MHLVRKITSQKLDQFVNQPDRPTFQTAVL
jgi:hypothetical protein